MEQSSQPRARREQRPWTEEDQRRAEELRAQGLSYYAIGSAMGRDRGVVQRRLDPEAREKHRQAVIRCHATNRRIGYDVRQPWTDELQRLAESLYEQGISFYAIAKRLGHDRKVVQCRIDLGASAKRRARGKSWRDRNPDRAAECCRQWRQGSSHPQRQEAILAYRRRWRELNRDRVRESNRRRQALRRSAHRSALHPLGMNEIANRARIFGDCCAYCGCAGKLTVDHVLALSAGGLDESANVVPACPACNMKKRAAPVEQWYRRQPFFSESRWRKIQRHCPGVAAGQLSLALAA